MIPIRREWSAMKRLALLSPALATPAVEDSATGNPLTFHTDLARPLKSLLIPFTPQQEGSGDPSPENIRPIVPWNGLTVKNGGANLFDGNYITGLIQNTAESAWYRNTGTSAKSAIIPCRPNTQYTIHKIGYASSNRFSIGLTSEYPENNMPVTLVVEDSGQGEKQRTFTTGANDNYIIVYVSTGAEMAEPDMMVNFGATALPFIPYHPITETDIVFPSAVYGGTLDVVSGVLTVEYVCESKRLSDYWSKTAGETHTEYTLLPFFTDSIKRNSNQKCNVAPYAWAGNNGTTHFYASEADGRVYVYLPNGTDETLEIVCVAELATPVEIQLTPAQLTALLGDNTIWSDADGIMTAVYLKKK